MIVPNIVSTLSSSFLEPLFAGATNLQHQFDAFPAGFHDAVFKVMHTHGLNTGKIPSAKLTALEIILELVIGLVDMKLVRAHCFLSCLFLLS
jgi:hypothetical protein